jgi:hypothetical protein
MVGNKTVVSELGHWILDQIAHKKEKIEISWFENQKSLLLMLQILQGLRRPSLKHFIFNLNFVRKYMGRDPGLMIPIRLTKIRKHPIIVLDPV